MSTLKCLIFGIIKNAIIKTMNTFIVSTTMLRKNSN